MLSRITNIWRKELMDNIRDRKALTQAILIPLIIGVFYAVFNPMLTAAIIARAKEPLTIPAQGIEHAGPAFLSVLKTFAITLEPFEGDLEAKIRSGETAAGLIIPAGFSQQIADEQSATLTLLTNQTAGGIFGGRFSAERLDLAINTYSRIVSVARLQVRQLDADLLNPVTLDTRDLATPEQLAGVLAAFSLPILLAVIVVQGGLFIAIDVTAGEKERGTLEALLATPASDGEVLLGKLAAVFTISAIPVVLTFIGFWLSSNLLPESVTEGALLPFSVILGAMIVGLPLALFMSVVLMIVSVRTKAFKDAQSAATPVMLAAMVPAFVAAFAPATNTLSFLIPIYGPAAALSIMAVGGIMPPFAVLFSILSSLIAAVAGFALALRFFNRERMLYSA
ncbi:MAG TPA: ABC transporter permease [Anaerolineae bacterium]